MTKKKTGNVKLQSSSGNLENAGLSATNAKASFTIIVSPKIILNNTDLKMMTMMKSHLFATSKYVWKEKKATWQNLSMRTKMFKFLTLNPVKIKLQNSN